jgi:hypothetical protein
VFWQLKRNRLQHRICNLHFSFLSFINFDSMLELFSNRALIRYTSTGNVSSAQAQPKIANEKQATPPKPKEKAVESTSFAMNLFRGKLRTEEIFPYPSSLTDEQRENLQALLDPTAKFFEVIFNPVLF